MRPARLLCATATGTHAEPGRTRQERRQERGANEQGCFVSVVRSYAQEQLSNRRREG
jgi:hypothetical protein